MIIDHDNRHYRYKWNRMGTARFNGAFYYSKEIVKNIIPNVVTDRNWMTVNMQGIGVDHSIVFVHNNLHPERYEWLRKFDDVVLVCSLKETCERVAHIGRPIYLPLSIDVKAVRQFRLKKEDRHGIAFAGRPEKRTLDGIVLPQVDIIENKPRQEFLKTMAHYEFIFAVGRTAIEAKALGCRLLPYDRRFPKTSVWKVLDNRDAAKILQERLDETDGRI